jgi:hypothetical protein
MTSDADYSPKYDDWSKKEYPPDWQDRRRIVLNKHNHRCQKCGIKDLPENDVTLEIDHEVPKSKGGSHALENLRPLCLPCHADEHPNHRELAQRATGEPTNSTSLLVTLFVLPIQIMRYLLLDPKDGVESISTSQERATVTAQVVKLWDPNHENMQQVGLLHDGDDKIKFTSWKTHEVKQVQEGTTYRIDYASVTEYEGDPQLELDTYTEIERV